MKIFDSVDGYLNKAKEGDLILFESYIPFEAATKHDVFQFIEKQENSIKIKQYKKRSLSYLYRSGFNQKIALLTKEEFNKLLTY